MNRAKKLLRFLLQVVKTPFLVPLVAEQNRFILSELARLNELLRWQALGETESVGDDDVEQTGASFSYQWEHLNDGVAMPGDAGFMHAVAGEICWFTGQPGEWFAGKKVLDLGCGIGRYSYGLLEMGAQVTSVDLSEAAVERTRELCAAFSDRHICFQKNLLMWDEAAAYDLVFCYGVVHHTGNTYRAIINAAHKVRGNGGRLFIMVYGFPETLADFMEVNRYEELRRELRNLPFEEKAQVLTERYGPALAHGYFDAVSPKINDLLTFGEIEELLGSLGFTGIRRTMKNRNHHITAERA